MRTLATIAWDILVGIALGLAIFFAIGVFSGPSESPSPAPETHTTVVVPAPTEDSVAIDYRGDLNRWTADGVVLPLDCPEEDSCTVDYAHGAWTFTDTHR